MKKQALVCLGVFLCSLFFSASLFAADKIGYVDLGRLFSEYTKTKDYDKVLGDKQAAYDTEREKKVTELKQLQDKMNLLSDKEKEAKKPELETKLKAFQDFSREKETDLRKEFSDKKSELIKDIDDTINKYATKEGYTFILNEVGTAYNAKALDITDKIVDILNKEYKK